MAAKKKPGRIVRIDPAIEKLVETKKQGRESISATLRRLLGLPSRKTGQPDVKVVYVLPSHVHESLEEARGAAIVEKVKRKLKTPERPLEFRELI